MDPEIRKAIKNRMLELLKKQSAVASDPIQAAKILIDLEKTSDSHTFSNEIESLKSELEALKSELEALKSELEALRRS